MIELRGLHLGNIARSPAESVRPDLWPDHAWVPALGCTGGRVYDLCGGSSGECGIPWQMDDSGSFALVKNINSETLRVQEGGPPLLAGIAASTLFAYFKPTPGTSTGRTIYAERPSDVPIYKLEGFGALNNNGLVATLRDNEGNLIQVPSTKDITSDGRYHSGCMIVDGISVTVVVDGDHVNQNWGSMNMENFPGSTPISIASDPCDPLAHFVGGIAAVMGYRRALRGNSIATLHADPLLPFRRRKPVYYSVPSGGDPEPPVSNESPAAMMMGI